MMIHQQWCNTCSYIDDDDSYDSDVSSGISFERDDNQDSNFNVATDNMTNAARERFHWLLLHLLYSYQMVPMNRMSLYIPMATSMLSQSLAVLSATIPVSPSLMLTFTIRAVAPATLVRWISLCISLATTLESQCHVVAGVVTLNVFLPWVVHFPKIANYP